MPLKKREPAKEKKTGWENKILEELQKRRLREEALARELAATEKNYKVVENTWRQILKKTEALKIKEDAEEAWRKFQHTVDIKDQVISLLHEALDQDEEQRARSEICQSEAVKQLLDIYMDRLTDLRQRNQELVKKSCATGRSIIQEVMQRSNEEAEHHHVIAYIAEITQIENELQLEAEIHAKLDESANKFVAQTQQMRTTLEKELGRILHQIISVVEEYQKRTADLHKAYLSLKKKNEKNAAEVHECSERTKSLQLLIKNLQDKNRKAKQNLASLDDLKEERKYFIHVYSRLRDFLRQDREGDTKRLTDLVRQSNESLKVTISQNMKWTREMTKKLIALVETHECLWKVEAADYRNKQKRQGALREIGEEFNMSPDEIKIKIHRLRSQYTNERKKITVTKSGSGAKDKCHSKWEFFDALQFMFRHTSTDNATVDSLWLKNIEKNGERILSLAKLCQHRQTEFETVIANGQEEMTDNLSTHDQPTVKEAVETCNKLANFWRRVGRAQKTVNVLAEEWKSLKAQNTTLRIQLYNCLTGFHSRAVSKHAIKQHKGTKGFAIIEASHMYKRLIL